MNKNDNKILKLKEQIKKQKEELKSISNFVPKTNLIFSSLTQDISISFNLNTISSRNIQDATNRLIEWNLIKNSAEEMKLEYITCGYNINDWIHDIKGRIELVSKKSKLKSLDDAEKKLELLLSNDKKVELDIENIENLLGNI